jgi:Flp pilus assembly pilin Flp
MINDNKPETESRTPRSVRKLAKNTRGAALTEYVILVGLVAMAAFGAYENFGKKISTKVGEADKKMDNLHIQ